MQKSKEDREFKCVLSPFLKYKKCTALLLHLKSNYHWFQALVFHSDTFGRMLSRPLVDSYHCSNNLPLSCYLKYFNL